MKQGTLEKIQNLAVSLQLVTVEDMRKHSLSQLVTMIANKLNELMNEVHRFESDVIEMVETQNDNIQYLLGEGLHLEVATVFENWMEDGTFDTLINQSALKKVNDRIDETNAQLSEKTFEFDSVEALKRYQLSVGDKVRTYGYYSKDDGGGAKYIIVSDSVTCDGGNYIQLNNGLKAKLVHNGTIYARQFGLKLDGVSDDTNALSNFMKNFGLASLVVDNGTCVITDTVFVKGHWRKDNSSEGYSNKRNRLTFINSDIKYMGSKKASLIFINHYRSKISGLSITRDSSENWIEFCGCWYIRFSDFEVSDIKFNVSNYIESIKSKASVDCLFFDGYIYDGFIELDSTGTYINNICFQNVGISSIKSNHCVVLKGGHLQKLTFDKCDLSYSTTSIFNIIDEPTTTQPSIILNNVYLDSAIPIFCNNDLKGFRLIKNGCVDASQNYKQKTVVSLFDYMNSFDLSTHSQSINHLPIIHQNLAKNGDLSSHISNSNWNYKSGDVDREILSHESGNVVRYTFKNTQGTIYFYGIPAPTTSTYVSFLRVRKVSGTGRLQIGFKGVYNIYDFSQISDGTELLMTCRQSVTIDKDDELRILLNKPVEDENNNLVIDIIEISILCGNMLQIATKLHPQADLSKKGKTSERPTNVNVGYDYYDTTLKKPIYFDGSTWRDSQGTEV